MLARYKYDPFGRRIEKEVNGEITRYLYDGPNIVAEYDAGWNVRSKYVHPLAVDDPMAVEQGANVYFYHKDGLGNVANLTDPFGNVVKSYTYKSFGEIYSETGILLQPYTFTAREYDPERGLYYYRARYSAKSRTSPGTTRSRSFPGGFFRNRSRTASPTSGDISGQKM